MTIASMVSKLSEDEFPIRFEAYDGSTLGPVDSPVTMRLKNERGLIGTLAASRTHRSIVGLFTGVLRLARRVDVKSWRSASPPGPGRYGAPDAGVDAHKLRK